MKHPQDQDSVAAQAEVVAGAEVVDLVAVGEGQVVEEDLVGTVEVTGATQMRDS